MPRVNVGGEETMRILPPERLPQGFPTALAEPRDPPPLPRPSATLCLLRDGPKGLEILLLRRSENTRFIPGAYVFPGGTVDPRDSLPALAGRLDGVDPGRAGRELKLEDQGDPPALAFWAAALRETFEETGILLSSASTPPRPQELDRLRTSLLAGEVGLLEVLEEMDMTLAAGNLVYMGHWITPVCEPLRFDTRFFAAITPPEATIVLHEAELSEAVWLTPSQALDRNAGGSLPLVFPTLRTLEDLLPYATPEHALAAMRGRDVPRLLPRLVPAEGGVGIVMGE